VRENPILKVCKVCQNTFETYYPQQKYCSHECSYKIQREKWKKKYPAWWREYTKICLACHKEFITGRYHKKFCSQKCKSEYQKRKYTHKRISVHWQILNRDNFRCQYCGRNPTQHGLNLVIDHIKPRADGGKTELDNLVTACEECNLAKSDRPLRHEAEFKKRLKRRNRFISSQTAFNFYLKPEDEENLDEDKK